MGAFHEEQARAIRHKDGPMLVLAGPGSGKTLVITYRTKYLIEQHKINPANILVVCGMDMMPNFSARSMLSSTLTFANSISVYSPETSSMTGDNILQGPHQSAKKSITTVPFLISSLNSSVLMIFIILTS